MNDITAKELIEILNLEPHPEGGYFKESYRAEGAIDGRSHSTAIYYLLEGGQRSRLHRLKFDELWHFYLGEPLTVVEISLKGSVTETMLGPDLRKGQRPQHVVKAGTWFGAYLDASKSFALIGCTVAPGFDFADFEMAERNELLRKYPEAKNMIETLT